MTAYWEKLRDPRWQRRRLEILQRSDFSCEHCEDSTSPLNVHHKLYRKGAMPWEYSDDELVALCETCHERQHEWKKLLDEAIAECHPSAIEQIVGFAQAIAAENYIVPDDDNVRPKRTWKMISYEHALGFCLRLQSLPAVNTVDDFLTRHTELSESQIFRYMTDGLVDGANS